MALSPEVYLLSSIVLNGDYQTAMKHGAVEEMFHVHAEEWNWLAAYYAKFRKTPSRNAFRRAWPRFTLKDVDDTGHYVEEVRKAHAKQELTALLNDQADLIAKGDITGAADLGMSGITKISAGMGAHEEIDALTDWKPIYNEVKKRKLTFDEFGMAGIPTGFETLDERTGGVGRGQSWILAARLGHGKSFAMLQMACSALLGGYNVHFAALEMSRHEVTMRIHNLLSSEVGMRVFQSTQLAQGRDFDLKMYRDFLEQLPKIVKGRLTVSDTKGLGAAEIASQIERNHPDVYYLDYLTLAKMRGDGGWQDIGKFSKDVKEIGGRYDVAMVSAAQLNRGGTDKDAGTETIGGSDQIGQDADAIIMLRKRSTRVTEFQLAKYRHGRDGFRWYNFLDLKTGKREEVSKDRALELIDVDKDIADDEAEQAAKRKPKTSTVVRSLVQKSGQQESIDRAALSTPRSTLRKLPK